ncbi:MAG: hypothetical protein JO018_07370 [Candidatus Eremiobacteraeota bacterium]|nr:hypothetical protein [Candidatus Eremiobacteraeota bacterium]
MRSSNHMRRVPFLALAILIAAVTACSRQPDVNSPQVRGIGYVRLDDVIKQHPLYSQLAQIDASIDALNLRTLSPGVSRTGAEIQGETAELNRELTAARTRANTLLQQKQRDYAQREQQAINAAIAASGEKPGQPAAQAMQQSAAAQGAAAAQQASRDFSQYQQQVVAQDRSAVEALSRQLSDRAAREYRRKADELTARESQASLEAANADSTQRLALRTKLNNLALDDATRAQVKGQLAALDRKEAQTVAAMRARDTAELAAFQTQLRSQTSSQLSAQVGAIHSQTTAKLRARGNEVSSQISTQLPNVGPAPGTGGLSAATQAKIQQIDRDYKSRFRADVAKTIDEFNRTRSELDTRFAALHGVDVGSQGVLAKQLDALHKQRDQLYNQIVAQIQRQMQGIAAQRGLKVVFVNIVVPAGGIDMTDDAIKAVQSLHE